MNKIKRSSLIVASLLLSVTSFSSLFFSEKAMADSLGTITKYSIPTANAGPHSIVQGADGNLWFTEESKNKIGKITTSGTITEYTLTAALRKPVGITNGPDGAIWFTAISSASNVAPYIGKISPSGAVTEFSLPLNSSPSRIVYGPDGNLWITDSAGNSIYRMKPDGSYTNFSVTAKPHFITSDPANNAVWFSERAVTGTGGYMGRITMDGTLSEYAFPAGVTYAFDVTKGPDGNIWFAAQGTSGQDKVGFIDSSFSFTTYDLPSTNRGPWTIRSGLDGNLWVTEFSAHKIARVTTSGSITEYTTSSNPLGLTMGADGNIWFTEYSGSSNKIGKIGIGAVTDDDSDGDGLVKTQELLQGSSDFSIDSDGDGLDDYKESQWFTARDDVFCNASTSYCEYPDPLQKDLYVEVDWMVKPGDYSTQPTGSHIASLEIALAGENIKPHFDNGNLGGGNEVPYDTDMHLDSSSSETDLYDYKYGDGGSIGPQFDEARYKVWHYMLVVDDIESNPNKLGVSFVADDDSMIAYGSIKNLHTSGFDDALSGAMMHELGHNLCLTSSTLYWGNPSCIFDGVDNNDPDYEDYLSSMSYHHYHDITDYSQGLNGSNDHDDWSALEIGMFAQSEAGDPVSLPLMGRTKAKNQNESNGKRIEIQSNWGEKETVRLKSIR